MSLTGCQKRTYFNMENGTDENVTVTYYPLNSLYSNEPDAEEGSMYESLYMWQNFDVTFDSSTGALQFVLEPGQEIIMFGELGYPNFLTSGIPLPGLADRLEILYQDGEKLVVEKEGVCELFNDINKSFISREITYTYVIDR